MSKRKPFNTKPGYKCSFKVSFGSVVLYDRRSGGDWIPGKVRWVVVAYDKDLNQIALLDVPNEKDGRSTMKDVREGYQPWVDEQQGASTSSEEVLDPATEQSDSSAPEQSNGYLKTFEVEFRPVDEDPIHKVWSKIRARTAEEAASIMGVHLASNVHSGDYIIVDRIKSGSRGMDISETIEFQVETPPDFKGEGLVLEAMRIIEY